MQNRGWGNRVKTILVATREGQDTITTFRILQGKRYTRIQGCYIIERITVRFDIVFDAFSDCNTNPERFVG